MTFTLRWGQTSAPMTTATRTTTARTIVTRVLPIATLVVALSFLGAAALRARSSDVPAAVAGPGTPAVQEMVVSTADFAFAAPRSIPAGLTRIILRNAGPMPHHVQLVRLAPGHTYPEFMDSLAKGKFDLPWATFIGGPEAPGPAGEAEATLMLSEGLHVMICLISGADHVPHLAKGMSFALDVTAPAAGATASNQGTAVPSFTASSAHPATTEPAFDVAMVLHEYAFDITPELTAGRHTIRVSNEGKQPHHVAIVRLGPGRTAQQALEWAATMQGPDPDDMLGGTTGIAPGLVNFVTLDFTPGEYALICFIPDASDGKSHAKHGMLRQLRVR